MSFARAVLYACLTVFGWLLYAAGGLLVLLALVNSARGDPPVQFALLVGIALVSAVAGFIVMRLARKMTAPAQL
ncbi:MAG: hypothetical protein WCH83_06325 [Alphaproteobacteria bacterium]|jgi:hypothetical protein